MDWQTEGRKHPLGFLPRAELSAPLPSATTPRGTFDLREFHRRECRLWGFFVVPSLVFFGVLLFFAGLLGGFYASPGAIEASHSNDIVGVALNLYLSGIAVFMLYTAATWPKWFPRALQVTDSCAVISYRSGRERVLRWSDPELDFQVLDNRPGVSDESNRAFFIQGSGLMGFAGFNIPPAAVNGLFDSINSAGCTVTQREDASARRTIYRITSNCPLGVIERRSVIGRLTL